MRGRGTGSAPRRVGQQSPAATSQGSLGGRLSHPAARPHGAHLPLRRPHPGRGYVLQLGSVGQVCIFLHDQRDFPVPSSAAFGRIGDAHVGAIHRFAEAEGVPVVRVAKGQSTEDVARRYLAAAPDDSTAKVAAHHRAGEGVRVALVEGAAIRLRWVADAKEGASRPPRRDGSIVSPLEQVPNTFDRANGRRGLP